MSPAQFAIPLAAALALSLLGLPRLPSVRRGPPGGGSSAMSRWALFAWLHPALAALLRGSVLAVALALSLWACWPWIGRPEAWTAALDAAWGAVRRPWFAQPS